MKQSSQIRRTALYCPLSQGDGPDGESNSIQNQKIILERYAQDHHLPGPCFYVDDGYSEGNFNRPGVRRMITDMEKRRDWDHRHQGSQLPGSKPAAHRAVH